MAVRMSNLMNLGEVFSRGTSKGGAFNQNSVTSDADDASGYSLDKRVNQGFIPLTGSETPGRRLRM